MNAIATPKSGYYIQLDGWKRCGQLRGSDGYSDDSFPGCQFYMHSVGGIESKRAVNVKVTGRTIQYKSGIGMVRVAVELVGDGEPSSFEKGWMDVVNSLYNIAGAQN